MSARERSRKRHLAAGHHETEVVVLGSGIASRSAAIALHDRGVAVSIVDERAGSRPVPRGFVLLPRSAVADAAGFAMRLGVSRFEQLVRASDEARRYWGSLVGPTDPPWQRVTRTSYRPFDPGHVPMELATLEHARIAAKERDGVAIEVDDGLVVDLGALLRRLDEEAERRGIVTLRIGSSPRLDSDYEHVELRAGSSVVRGSRAVLALGDELVAFDPWVSEITLAASARGLVARPRDGAGPLEAELAGDALESFPTPDGSIVVVDGRGGAEGRRAPESSASSEVASPSYSRHRRTLDDRFPGAVIEYGFSRALLHSCDGLPLVGPHPMRAGVLLFSAFDALELAWCPSAAKLLASWIVDGKPTDEAFAQSLSPRRML